MTAKELWQEYIKTIPCLKEEYEAWQFGDDPDTLAALVVNGTKTATASLHCLYEFDNEPLPKTGEYSVVLNSADEAVCVIRTNKVYLARFCDVTDEQAFKEGEGDRSLAYWRRVHEAFFSKELEEYNKSFNEEMDVVCEEFEVVYTPAPEYYNAYDLRYKAIHALDSTWASDTPTPIIAEIIQKYGITKDSSILEIGCGEGRDSAPLLEQGYNLLSSDVSAEAVRFCKEKYAAHCESFRVIDACRDDFCGKFDFIFAASVLHMLTEDGDRSAFLRFIRRNLKENGVALILTMGDGEKEFCTDPSKAFELQERTNNADGIAVTVTNTSCRTVSFATLKREIEENRLHTAEHGITQSPPDFPSLMYAVVRHKQ